MQKFKLVTLGCRTNQYETEAFRYQLKGLGMQEAQEQDLADLCIVNTCTVTESADSSSRAKIRKLRKENPDAKIIVTGCLAERMPTLKEQMPEIDQLIGLKGKESLIQDLYPQSNVPEFVIDAFEGHTRAFVKVQDGCNSFCSYCIIPYVRGRSRSRSLKEVVTEVERLVFQGKREVVITGINVGDYRDGSYALSDLMEAVDQIEGLLRIRLSSIDPDEIDERLLGVILNSKRICHNLHLVLQSGSNTILKAMRRKYTRKDFLNAVEMVLEQDPDFTFTTDIIVGFPGESEEDFIQTLDLVEKGIFVKVHMFPYSRREGTLAAKYMKDLPDSTIFQRKHRLLEAEKKASYDLRQKFIGRKTTVLVEKQEEHYFTGYTPHFFKVRVFSPTPLEPNTLATVLLEQNYDEGFIGIPA